jgi:hypothetical protein
MADNFITATVSPELPLTDAMVEVLNVMDYEMEMAIGGGDDDFNVDRAAEICAEAGHALSREALVLLADYVLCTGGDEVGLEAYRTHEGYYLCAENNFGDADLRFLTWLIAYLPPEIDAIEVEWATWCSKARAGEFGGGCARITRSGCMAFTTGRLLDELRKPDA